MFEARNPIADLIEVENISEGDMKNLEQAQLGVYRAGGKWQEIMKDGNIKYEVLKTGRRSDFKKNEYDIVYKLISGNY